MTSVNAVVIDALVGSAARPGRMFLTALGAMIGVATLVAISGLTTTASAQILGRFDSVATTHVRVTVASDDVQVAQSRLAWTGVDNLLSLNGVSSASMLARVDGDDVEVSRLGVADPAAADEIPFSILAADERFAESMEFRIAEGRSFDRGHVSRGDPVVLLGATAADRLGVSDLRRQRVIVLDSMPFEVIGIFDRSPADQAYLSAIVLPAGAGVAKFGVRGPDLVEIKVVAGAAPLIARQAPLALNPLEPDRLIAEYAPEPRALREQVSGDTQSLFLIVALVSTLAGAVGIMNTMLVSVLERTSEIGLRRAVGARRREILVQFLAEAGVVGLLGGIVGTSVGSMITVAVAEFHGWIPTAEWWIPAVGVLVGCLTGVVAGLIPSWRASQIEPAVALRAA